MRRRGILTQNHKKNRSRTEIICDILESAKNDGTGAGKTKMMSSAFV